MTSQGFCKAPFAICTPQSVLAYFSLHLHCKLKYPTLQLARWLIFQRAIGRVIHGLHLIGRVIHGLHLKSSALFSLGPMSPRWLHIRLSLMSSCSLHVAFVVVSREVN